MSNDRRHVNQASVWMRDSELLNWLISLPAVKAQAYFWNYSSRRERRKAMLADMRKDAKNGE